LAEPVSPAEKAAPVFDAEETLLKNNRLAGTAPGIDERPVRQTATADPV